MQPEVIEANNSETGRSRNIGFMGTGQRELAFRFIRQNDIGILS